MTRRVLGLVFFSLSYNFLFLADSAEHVKIGLVWLAVTAIVLWPDIQRALRRFGLVG